MSVIAIDKVPITANLKRIVKIYKKPIHGQFEALNFGSSKYSKLMKTCYLRLSETLDPVQVVQNINNNRFVGKGAMYAFIPDDVPDMPVRMPVCTSSKSKKKRVPVPKRKMVRLGTARTVGITTDEIMSELQAKYRGIVVLSAKYNHKLLQDIAKIIHERVSVLVSQSPEVVGLCFKATSVYRRAHPHSGDFQLVLSTLHAIQDAAGIPREHLNKRHITKVKSRKQGPEMPIELVRSYCQKYSTRIATQMTEYVKGLDVIPNQMDTEEGKSRKRIRMELKKLQPFLTQIVTEVVNTRCLPEEKQFRQVRIYGEPFLPSRETLLEFVACYKPRRAIRSKRMFNMFMLSVPSAVCKLLLDRNNTVLNGKKQIKLIIVASDSVRSHPWKTGTDGEERSEEDNTDEDEENYD